ncbi:hypothetical protein MRX96_033103 [Rhipicephalus microplus]
MLIFAELLGCTCIFPAGRLLSIGRRAAALGLVVVPAPYDNMDEEWAILFEGAFYIPLQGKDKIKVPIPLSVNYTKHPGKASFYPDITGIPVTLQESTLRQASNYNRYHGASATTGFREQQSQGGISGGRLREESWTAQ